MRANIRRLRWTLGIRGRLLLAFLGISAFVVVAAVAAVQALLQLSSLVGEITEHRTPAIITSLSMSREVERILGATQELAEVDSLAVFEQKSHAVALAADDLEQLAGRLAQVQKLPVEDISVLVERMRANVSDLEAKVLDRLSAAEHKQQILADLLRTDLLFQAAMMGQTRPLISEAERIAGGIESQGDAIALRPTEVSSLLQLNSAQALLVAFAHTHDLLLIGAAAPSEEELELNRITVQRSIVDLDQAVIAMPLYFVRAVQISSRLRSLAVSDDGVLALRLTELADLKAADALQARNTSISQQLVAKVDGLVQEHASRVQESMEETDRVRRDSMLRLILVTAGTLCCSGLIVWLYVNRHVGARLAAVSDSMLALANGDLAVKLPDPEYDEIGLMASSLAVFQTTALEAQEREALLEEARERSERARETADLANRAKSEFLANMSHEIRTPINAIAGFTSLALRTELTAKQSGYLEKVHAATQGLLRVINDLLDFSKIEAGHLEMEHIAFRLAEVIDSVMGYIGPLAESKGLELLISVAPEVPSQLVGDALRLGQVLTNLCGNAVKFTEAGEIELRVVLEQRVEGVARLLFAVRDTGIGLGEAQAAKLFQPFTQADSSTTRKFGGTGLGLVISQRLVAMMNGTIWLESQRGVGTTFFFRIELPAAAESLPGALLLPDALRGEPALVVDDNGNARQILSAQLKQLGMLPYSVPDGEAALSELRRASASGRPYPLVLMDWKMPEMDGVAATRAIREDPAIAGTPVIIMVTAYGREQAFGTVEEAALLDGVLLKPVTHALLAETLCRLLGDDPSAVGLSSTPWQTRLAGVRLLLVEDSPINQQLVTEMMEQEGAEVQVAGNGRLALEIVEDLGVECFDAALLDLQMPEMDGFETARRIREFADGESLPLIALTAHAMEEDRARCFAVGMQDHIAKPVDRDVLVTRLRQWLGAEKLARAGARPHRARGRGGDQPVAEAVAAAAPPDLEPLLRRFTDKLATVTNGLQKLPARPRRARSALDSAALPAWVDRAAAIGRLGGEAEFYGKLMRDFVRSQAGAADDLASALSAGDGLRLGEQAHLLRGLAANLSALRIMQAAAAIEDAAAAGALEAAGAPLAILRDAMTELVRAVEQGEPEAEAASRPGAAADPVQPKIADAAPRLLVVDDVPANLFVIEKMLQALSLRGKMVTSAAEALRAMESQRFDAVITDCHMPEMSGFELAAAIRQREADGARRTVIVGVSGNDSAADVTRCLESGMDDFLAKPLSAGGIRQVLARWLENMPASAL